MRPTVAGVHLADAGRAASRRIGPLFVGVAIAGAVIFGPNGMTAADAVGALASSAPLSLGLFVAWVLASAPAARLLFGTPSTLYLRALAPPSAFYLPAAASLALVELPWILLHLRGAGPLAGLSAFGTAAGAHALLAARGVGVVGFGALAAGVALAPGWGWLATAGLIALAAGVPAAVRAAAVAPARGRGVVGGPPVVALALALLASAWRGARASFTRAALVVGGGAAATALIAGNHALAGEPLLRLSLGMGAPVIALALGGVVTAILAAEVAAGWLLDTPGVPPRARATSRALALATVGAVAGAAHGGVAAGLAGAAAGVPWGAALTVAVGAAVRRAAGREDLAFILAAAVAAAFATIAGLA